MRSIKREIEECENICIRLDSFLRLFFIKVVRDIFPHVIFGFLFISWPFLFRVG